MDPDNYSPSGNGQGRPAGYLPAPEGAQYGWDEPRVELRDYMRIVMKRRRVILLTFLGVMASAAVYTFTAPKIYQATAKVQVLQPQISPMAAMISDAAKSPEVSMKTQAKIVQSSIIAQATSDRLRLQGLKIPAGEIGGSIKVAIEDPDVLAISAQHTDPARAALIANAVELTYVEHNKTVARAEASSQRQFLEQQRPRVEADLKHAEDQINAFKTRYNIRDNDPLLSAQAQLAMENSAEAEHARLDLQTSAAQLNSLRQRFAVQSPTHTVQKIANDPTAEGLRQEMANTEVELAKAHASFEPSHPKVAATQDRLDSLRQEWNRRYGQKKSTFTLESVEEPDPAYEALKQEIREQETNIQVLKTKANILSGSAAADQSKLANQPQVPVELERLEHAKDVAEKAYLTVLEELQKAQLDEVGMLGAARMVDVAQKPGSPVSPKKGRTLTLAFIVGLMAGVSLALLQEYADTSVHDPDELMLRTGITSLGFIPAARDTGTNVKVAARSPKSPIAEGFRSIRSNLKFAHLDSPLRSLAITSAGSGEGKSFTAANMAIVFAQSGAKTILVDADLRRPTVHRTFGIDHTPGLTNVLAGEVTISQVLRSTEIDNLQILPSGSVPPNPSELLDSQRMTNVLELLKEQADVVIFDTPPALVVTDAIVLSAKVDTTLLVIEQGRASARAIAEIRRMVEQARGHVAGAVINKVRAGAGDYYYYYYYRYYYYYGDRDGKKGGRRHHPLITDAAEEPAALPADRS